MKLRGFKTKKILSNTLNPLMLVVSASLTFPALAVQPDSVSTNSNQQTKSSTNFKESYESEFEKYKARLKVIKARASDTLVAMDAVQKPFESSVTEVNTLQSDLLEVYATLTEGGALHSSLLRLHSWADQNVMRIRDSKRYSEKQKSRYIQNYKDLIDNISNEQDLMLIVKGELEELKNSFELARDDLAEAKRMEDAELALQTLKDYLTDVSDLVDSALNPKVNGILEESSNKNS